MVEEGKRKRGRPKVDRDAPPVTLDAEAKTATLHMPPWWFAMAHLEAEWRAKGLWKHSSKGNLARHFTPTGNAADGKSAAAVTKARADPRYQAIVAGETENWRRTLEAVHRDPEAAEARRASIRASLEAAWAQHTGKPDAE